MIIMLPAGDGELGLPKLTGMVFKTWSSLVTVSDLVALSPVSTSFAPMFACTLRSFRPYAVAPSDSPPVAIRKESLVPACQYSLGRKWISLALNQFHAPSWGGSLVTKSRFWTAA